LLRRRSGALVELRPLPALSAELLASLAPVHGVWHSAVAILEHLVLISAPAERLDWVRTLSLSLSLFLSLLVKAPSALDV